MSTKFEELKGELRAKPRSWMVTGCAGFIGSNLVETLLGLDQTVIGVDNFATGKKANLEGALTGANIWQKKRFSFVEGDIRSGDTIRRLLNGVEFVLHQAALGSVPKSFLDPVKYQDVNAGGHLAILEACRVAGVKNVVYASSSSVYGDSPKLPKVEGEIGRPLSPYAASKRCNEIYAEIYAKQYAMKIVGLRYFNVFGPRQDPEGMYAAVIPKWIAALLRGERPQVFGDGETSRDFCYVDNVVQANLLAAAAGPEAAGLVFNVACGGRTTLNELVGHLNRLLGEKVSGFQPQKAEHLDFRNGDIRHSLADVSAARQAFGYEPKVMIEQGLRQSLDWYVAQATNSSSKAA